MNSTRALVVLALGVAALAAACGEDGTLPPYPDKPPQIEYTVAHTRSTGLPNSDVTSFLNVSDDLFGSEFWVGTRGGVARFSSPGDTQPDTVVTEITGLPHPDVTSMVQLESSVYVGTWGGGVGVYSLLLGTWQKLLPGENGLTDAYISGMAVSESEDRIYLSTNDGVFIYDPSGGTFTHQSTVDPDLDPEENPDDVVTMQLQQVVSSVEVMDTLGVVERWYGPRVEVRLPEQDKYLHGIFISKNTSPDPYKYTTANSGLAEPNVNDIFYDRATNTFWVAYVSKGISRVSVEQKTWTLYDLSDGLPSFTIYSIARARDNESGKSAIWAATQNGLAKLVDDSNHWQSYGVSSGLPSARVHSVHNDGEHVWAGFIDAGAVRIK